MEVKLGLDEDDPATRSATTAVEGAIELTSQARGGARVGRRRSRTGVKLTVQNLSHQMSGYRLEVIVRGTGPCWIGHGRGSLAGHMRTPRRTASGDEPALKPQQYRGMQRVLRSPISNLRHLAAQARIPNGQFEDLTTTQSPSPAATHGRSSPNARPYQYLTAPPPAHNADYPQSPSPRDYSAPTDSKARSSRDAP